MRFVRLAFIEKNTGVIDRLYFAWCAVFIVRIWSVSLEKASSSDIQETLSTIYPSKSFNAISKRNLFISVSTLFSLELNVHSLTYLLVLVAEKQITDEALQVIFNSQICESYFRSSRSVSGVFSSVVNFTVNDFLHRASKLSALQEIKSSSEQKLNNLAFPKHHKLWKKTNSSGFTSPTSIITEETIEDTISSAYFEASRILRECDLTILTSDDQMISFDEVNRMAFDRLVRSQTKTSNTQSFQWGSQTFDEDDDDDDNEEEPDKPIHSFIQPYNNNNNGSDDDSLIDIDESDPYVISNVAHSTIRGVRIYDAINEDQSESFFRVKINDQDKFMHKQSATWYLSKDKVKLSTDRLKRVQSQK